MDGDVAPARELSEVCARHGALLVLDEAHAVLQPEVDLHDDVDVVRVGTLSKTLGALGGFVAGPARYTDLVVNRARSYIFTTASTPADTAAALAALDDPAIARRRRVADATPRQHRSPAAESSVADHPVRLWLGAARDRGRGGAPRRRPAGHRHPAADRGSRDIAASRHLVGCAHGGTGRTARARARRALPRMTRPDLLVVRRGHRYRGRQDLVDRRRRPATARGRPRRRGAQAGAVVRAR